MVVVTTVMIIMIDEAVDDIALGVAVHTGGHGLAVLMVENGDHEAEVQKEVTEKEAAGHTQDLEVVPIHQNVGVVALITVTVHPHDADHTVVQGQELLLMHHLPVAEAERRTESYDNIFYCIYNIYP